MFEKFCSIALGMTIGEVKTMKTFFLAATFVAAQCAFAQLPFTSGNAPFRGCSQTDVAQRYGCFSSEAETAVQPRMRASEEPGVSAKQFFGEGTGALISYGAPESFSTSYGFTGGFYMPLTGSFIAPVFATVRHNFLMQSYGDAAFGALYGFASGGPALGFGSDPYAPTIGSFLHSLTFRPGAGAIAGFGAELGGESFGWSVFTEAGAAGFAFTAPLGPQKTYAAPYFSFGVRRGVAF